MKRCIGQGAPCLLCYYGLSLRPAARPRGYAGLHKSVNLDGAESRPPSRKPRRGAREAQWVERQVGKRDDRLSRDSKPGARSRHIAVGDGLERVGTKLGNIVFRPANAPGPVDETEPVNIFKRLESSIDEAWVKHGEEGEADRRLLQDLDPTGEVWTEFVEGARGMFGKPTSCLEDHQKEFYMDLTKSLSEEMWKSNSRRLLRFHFMDEALRKQGFDFNTVLGSAPDIQHPVEWYPAARYLQRRIHLHVGPTNSGKTYNALKRLEQAGSGFYAGPLRLLAHEVYQRFNAKGIPCDLVTGDDVRLTDDENTTRIASTVEMVNTGKPCDVAVIDEVQMIADQDRGWAWTRALLATQAREIHLCGEERVVPLIRDLAMTMGDKLQIHKYERLNPLKAMSRSLRGDLRNLQKGDCVVVFSVVGIHAMKNQIETETGRRVAIIYGSLPPETRAQQAVLFNEPDNDYDFLVASDAIGMGLNLSIKRIVFETLVKFNGRSRDNISIPQLKQIAGRAGRYRTARDDTQTSMNDSGRPAKPAKTVGLVTCIDENDLPTIREALETETPPITQAGLLPPGQYLEEYNNRLPPTLPFEYVLDRVCKAASTQSSYRICDIRSQLDIAHAIEPVKDLSLTQRYTFCASPADVRSPAIAHALRGMARCISQDQEVTIVDIPEIPLEVLDERPRNFKDYLNNLETLHKIIILYCWLAYRYQTVLGDIEMAFHAKEMVEEKINICLTKFSANPRLGKKLQSIRSQYGLKINEDTRAKGEGNDSTTTVEEASGEAETAETPEADYAEYAPPENEAGELSLAVQELAEAAEDLQVEGTSSEQGIMAAGTIDPDQRGSLKEEAEPISSDERLFDGDTDEGAQFSETDSKSSSDAIMGSSLESSIDGRLEDAAADAALDASVNGRLEDNTSSSPPTPNQADRPKPWNSDASNVPKPVFIPTDDDSQKISTGASASK